MHLEPTNFRQPLTITVLGTWTSHAPTGLRHTVQWVQNLRAACTSLDKATPKSYRRDNAGLLLKLHPAGNRAAGELAHAGRLERHRAGRQRCPHHAPDGGRNLQHTSTERLHLHASGPDTIRWDLRWHLRRWCVSTAKPPCRCCTILYYCKLRSSRAAQLHYYTLHAS